jgi:uncharacterized protein (TIRG00374 family)
MDLSFQTNPPFHAGFQESSIPPKPKLKRYLLLLLFLGLTLYLVLPQFSAIERALLVIRHLKPFFLAVAFGTQVLSYLGSGYLLKKTVARTNGPLSVADGMWITIGANSIGTLGGGVLGTAGMSFLWLRRRGVPVAAAGLGGWLPIFLNDVVLATVSLTGLVVLLWMHKFPTVLAAGLGVVVLILVAAWTVLLWGLTHRSRVMSLARAIVGWAAKLRGKRIDRSVVENTGRQVLDYWDMFFESGWRGPVIGAAVNTGFDMLTLASLFAAAGHSVSLPVLIAGYGAPQLLGKLTVILGGLGVVEATMVGLYHSLNIPSYIVVIVVLAYRLLSFWLPTFLGIALVPYLDRKEAAQIPDPGRS